MKKIAFPSFNKSQHGFLLDHWWFRLCIVLHVLLIAVVFLMLWVGPMSYFYAFVSVALSTLAATIAIHYVIQFFFFKVIIDFVYLGSKNANK